MKLLAIESSCDETAAAVLDVRRGIFHLEKTVVASQIKIHARYGGVVPEVAARSHVAKILPVIMKALGKRRPDCIAVTAGPGLVTSLLVGVETARTLSYLWNKPLVAVNHIAGHISANWLEEKNIPLPALALVVSGGHTELIHMKDHTHFQLIGATRDDAAGEAFDKAAKMLGLGYPGGPEISRRARLGHSGVYRLPRPMIDSGDANFSFSGLKTAVLYLVERLKKEKKLNEVAINDVSAEFECAAVDVLVSKTIAEARRLHVKSVIMGGGVVANQFLRDRMKKVVSESLPETACYYPDRKNCTDNAAMIAVAGYFKAREKKFTSWDKIVVDPNWKIYA